VAGTCERGNELSGYKIEGNLLTSREPVSFSRRTFLHAACKYSVRPTIIINRFGIEGFLYRFRKIKAC
jgi:hypothetical protein